MRAEAAAETIVGKAAYVALAVGRGGEIVGRVVGVGGREERSDVLDDLGEVTEGVQDIVFDVAIRVGRGGRPLGVEVRGGADNVARGEDALESVVRVGGVEGA